MTFIPQMSLGDLFLVYIFPVFSLLFAPGFTVVVTLLGRDDVEFSWDLFYGNPFVWKTLAVWYAWCILSLLVPAK